MGEVDGSVEMERVALELRSRFVVLQQQPG